VLLPPLAVAALVVVVPAELLPHAAIATLIARLAQTHTSSANMRLRRWDLLFLGIGLASE
jgi:hypothetical protein